MAAKKSKKRVVRKAAEKPFTMSQNFREMLGTSVGASLGAMLGRSFGKDPERFVEIVGNIFTQLKNGGLGQLFPGFDGVGVTVGAPEPAPAGLPWWATNVPAVWNFGLIPAVGRPLEGVIGEVTEYLHAFPSGNEPLITACGACTASGGPAKEGARRCEICESVLRLSGYDVSDLRNATPPGAAPSTSSTTPTTPSAGRRKKSRKPKTSE